MLIQNAELDNQQLTDLDGLCATCKTIDGNVTAIYRHLVGKNRGRPSNRLYYAARRREHSEGSPVIQENAPCVRDDVAQLAGFLGAFFFMQESCEISLMIAPDYRRQGLATRMLKAIWPLIESEGVNTLVFSSPHGLNDDWFVALGLSYLGSEFQMQLTDKLQLMDKLQPAIQNINIRAASIADIPALCTIDAACFSAYGIDMPSRLYLLLNDPAHAIFIINQDATPIGKAYINWQPKGARLSDIAIIPSHQGHGLGSMLIDHCIHHILTTNGSDIVLDVETSNKQALGLYTRLGFSISNAIDYWRIHTIGLTDFIPAH